MEGYAGRTGVKTLFHRVALKEYEAFRFQRSGKNVPGLVTVMIRVLRKNA
jgi:hypothetical protein